MGTTDNQSVEEDADEEEKTDSTEEATKQGEWSGNDPGREDDRDTATEEGEQREYAVPRRHISRKDAHAERTESEYGESIGNPRRSIVR